MALLCLSGGLFFFPLLAVLSKNAVEIAMPFYTFAGTIIVGYKVSVFKDDHMPGSENG